MAPVNGTILPDFAPGIRYGLPGEHPRPFAGRTAESLALARRLDTVDSGTVTLVEGGMGTGKTTLLREGAMLARERGFRVLTAACSAAEADFPFQLVQRLAGVPAPVDTDDRAALHAAGAQLYERIRELTRGVPLLVVVDDIQWCDHASLQCLAFLARRLHGRPAGLLVSRLSGSHAVDQVVLDELLRTDSHGQRIVLSPLDETAVGAVLAEELGPAAGALRSEVTRWTGGNAFLLGEVVSRLTSEAGAPVAEIVPPGVHTWLRSRLPAGTGCLAVARALAVLGDRGDIAQIAATAGLPVPEAAEAVRTLADLGLVRRGARLGFAQPMVEAAVRDGIPPSERARLYLAGAAQLRATGAPDEEVIAYLVATHAVEYPCTAELLLAAVAGLRDRMPVPERVALLRSVLSRPLPSEARGRIVHQLAEAELDLDPAVAEARFVEADRFSTGLAVRKRIAVQRALALRSLGREPEAARLLHAVASGLTGVLRDRVAVQLGAADLAGPARRVVTVLSGAEEPDLDFPLSAAWDLLGPADPLGLPAAWALLTRALASAGLASRVLPYAVSWVAACGQGPLRRLLAHGAYAEVLLRLGRIQRAAEETASALDLLVAPGTSPPRGMLVAALPPLIETLVERDDPETAQRVLAETGLDGELPSGLDPVPLLLSRGRLRHAFGDAEGGFADLVRAGRSGGTAWRVPAVPVLVEFGRRGAARELARAELAEARAREQDRTRLGVALRLAGQATGGAAGVELLTESVTVLESAGAWFELAGTLGVLGVAMSRNGRLPGARNRLRRACALAEETGAVRLHRLLEQRLREAGSRVRGPLHGPAALTASERRIARLAVAGHTNRQIAERLFVTQRAVEMHLTQVYRKLAITGRRELGGRLGE
ncbi:AAA family ATPase [Amycolatopsis azurea]|uniref:AAA family ATPase n=1 Tax=Amycolatopsis azurea TaxID=36819 RepID=UPI00381EE8C0